MRERLITFIIYVISNEEFHHAVTLWNRVAICIHIFYLIRKDKVLKEKLRKCVLVLDEKQYVMYSLILHDNGFLKDGHISIVQEGKQCIWKQGIIKPPDI